VSFAVFGTVVIAKIVGGILPLFAKLIKADPAIMAAPLITTIVDALSLIFYFFLAGIFLGIS
ncbi:MAG TPA: magnesium transporter, partial [Clostridiaceae bacterium]|nr:magnesium transporter [Clostridiaceae bacterium]